MQTAAIMQWFSALIPAYPEIQKKAQEELDRVVGRSRLPNIEDEKNLPYCHAIVKEVRHREIRYQLNFHAWLTCTYFLGRTSS